MSSSAQRSLWLRYTTFLVLAVVAVGIYLLTGGADKTGTAYFTTVNNIYPGDSIRILGMQVGQIDKITPDGDKVRVDFHYDAEYSLPADVKAAILSPTLVATRFIQLDPAYTTGPVLPDGGTIPEERTAVPVEFDELKKQIDQVSDALGPNGANKDGALNRALEVINENGVQDGVGQGQPFHDMVTELSKAAKTLSDGRGDLFGTVNNLAHFSEVLNQYDSQIVEFQSQLADVSNTLDDNSDQLRQLLPRIDDAGTQVDKFIKEHGNQLHETIERAGSISRNLYQIRDQISGVLHVGPNALTNFTNIFNPRNGGLNGSVTVANTANFSSPGSDICALITTAAYANEMTAQRTCVQYLGPVFSHLAMQAPPVGLSPVTAPRGSTPSYGNLDGSDVDRNYSPNGTGSDLPRSSTANGNDHTYSDNGFPIAGVPVPNPTGGN
jgi:phospholipid/cholesterol/gamma-HCH transport system substrate-binding protein